MINGSVTDFIDQLYYGQELVFAYNGKKYFIQGWMNDDKSESTMVLTEVDSKPFAGYLWEYKSDNMRTCAEAFLTAPIWDDKDFLQIQESVIWSDW